MSSAWAEYKRTGALPSERICSGSNSLLSPIKPLKGLEGRALEHKDYGSSGQRGYGAGVTSVCPPRAVRSLGDSFRDCSLTAGVSASGQLPRGTSSLRGHGSLDAASGPTAYPASFPAAGLSTVAEQSNSPLCSVKDAESLSPARFKTSHLLCKRTDLTPQPAAQPSSDVIQLDVDYSGIRHPVGSFRAQRGDRSPEGAEYQYSPAAAAEYQYSPALWQQQAKLGPFGKMMRKIKKALTRGGKSLQRNGGLEGRPYDTEPCNGTGGASAVDLPHDGAKIGTLLGAVEKSPLRIISNEGQPDIRPIDGAEVVDLSSLEASMPPNTQLGTLISCGSEGWGTLTVVDLTADNADNERGMGGRSDLTELDRDDSRRSSLGRVWRSLFSGSGSLSLKNPGGAAGPFTGAAHEGKGSGRRGRPRKTEKESHHLAIALKEVAPSLPSPWGGGNGHHSGEVMDPRIAQLPHFDQSVGTRLRRVARERVPDDHDRLFRGFRGWIQVDPSDLRDARRAVPYEPGLYEVWK